MSAPPPAARIAGASLLLIASIAGVAMSYGRGPIEPASAPTEIVVRLIDLNSAPPAELELLPRIGPALAARIVEDRQARGPYRSLEDLDRVRGIGPLTIEKLRGLAEAVPAR